MKKVKKIETSNDSLKKAIAESKNLLKAIEKNKED